MIYLCCNDYRREAVRALHSWKGIDFNGIDYLEVQDTHTLKVHFIHPLVTVRITTLHMHALSKENVSITGGERIHDVGVVEVSVDAGEQPNVLIVKVNKPGDRSTYTLQIKPDPHILQLDPQLSEVDFTFNSTGEHTIDCEIDQVCQPELPEAPEIDYMAKDFISLRQLMLDRLAILMPQWSERSVADIGVMLVEILAYVGDHLSYQQDVIATESYLNSARRRVSVRRHARLLDYFMSEGCNARGWVQVQVNEDIVRQPGATQSPLPLGTQFVTKVDGMDAVLLPDGSPTFSSPAQFEVFETMYDVDALFKEHNLLSFYTWGAQECCLPKGATRATLKGRLENLQPGDILIFREVLGAHTGLPEDAEPVHRQAVRLTSVTITQDPLGALSTGRNVAGRSEEVIRITEKDRFVEEIEEKRGDDVVREEHVVEEVHTIIEKRIIEDGRVIEDQTQEEDTVIEEDQDEEEDTQELPAIRPDMQSEREAHRGRSAREKRRHKRDKQEDENEEVIVEEEFEEERHSEADTREEVAGEIEEDKHALDETIKRSVETEVKDEKGIGFEETRVLTETTTVEEEDTKKEVEPDYSIDITEIEWHYEDALLFPLCISSTTDYAYGHIYYEDVSVALGNIVLADHGQTMYEVLPSVPASTIRWASTSSNRCDNQQVSYVAARYNPSLKYSPLTFSSPYDASNPPPSAFSAMQLSAHNAIPAIKLCSQPQNTGDSTKEIPCSFDQSSANVWFPKGDLLSSKAIDRHFVIESESDGITYLRFGDDQHGLRPRAGTSFLAKYRVGNGARGNVGADAIYHIMSDDTRISGVNNPLPALGGVEPESIEDVRQKISRSFITQERGVTPEDYLEIVGRHPEVSRANTVLRWTGSWYTVFIVVERIEGMPVDEPFKREVRQYMEQSRMAGGDIEIVSPVYVPLEIEMTVDVQTEYFRNNVKATLLEVFSNRQWPDGQRGVFYPSNFTFGQSVYLNLFYVAATQVPGVASVNIFKFQRQGIPGSGQVDGVLTLDWLEIARLDNDPYHPERGTFLLNVRNGK